MRRRFELIFYAVIICLIILDGVEKNDTYDRRPHYDPPQKNQSPPPILPDHKPQQPDSTPFIPQEVYITLEEKTRNGIGTGFAVGGNSFVTARHVIDSCAKIYVRYQAKRFIEAQNIYASPSADFATFNVAGVGINPVRLIRDGETLPNQAFLVGYPQGKPADVHVRFMGKTTLRTGGRYSTRETVNVWSEIKRLPNFSGSLGGISGGPAFGPDGSVIGTAVAESPRRGRTYTTDPSVFQRTGVTTTNRQASNHVSPGFDAYSFGTAANALRDKKTVIQVYCKV